MRAAGSALVFLERLLHLVLVLRTDRELQSAALAIHADELGFDLVADLQDGAASSTVSLAMSLARR